VEEAVVRDDLRLVGARSARADAVDAADPAGWPRRLIGVLVLGLAALPVFLLLDAPDTGLAGWSTAGAARTYASLMWLGALLLAAPALIVARLVSWRRLHRWAVRVARVIARAPIRVLALSAALAALLVTVAFSRFVLHGQPVLIDAMSQLLHARWIAAGKLAGPVADLGAFVHLQQSLFTEHGWVSQYPPGFALLLAAGFRMGVVGLVGPLLMAVTAFFTMLAADRLLPGRRAEARVGAGLVAFSPLLIAQAGAYMNHAAAAAFSAAAVWAGLRAQVDGRRWAVIAGAAAGGLYVTRPLTAIAITPVIAALVVARPVRLVWLVAGAAPFVIAMAVWNAHFFGAPDVWGYAAALGPAAGPGFGVDPWGNAYGIPQALSYTSAELTALSVFLFETPFPVVAMIGLGLVFAPRMAGGERVVLAWALLPLAAHFFYWHHGLFMGPRMLADAAPAWGLLAVLCTVSLVRRVPAGHGAWSPRVFASAWAIAAILAGALWLGPARLASYRLPPSEAMRAIAGVEGPALVFVHGGWTSRVAMRLAAGGMRLDSVETALRQNTTCAVEQWINARERGETPGAGLDFTPRATGLPSAVEISPGNRMRTRPGERMPPVCAREIAADARGVIEVATLFWRGELPGMDGPGVVFVRDLGPARNAQLLARFRERRPWFLLQRDPVDAPALVPYAEGEALLWPSAPEA